MKYKVDYEFILHEEKEIGGMITVKDGSNFLLSATYKYCNQLGTILSEGIANVDGNRVFILLIPTVDGDFQFVEFTITIIPLNQDGSIDTSKNPEKLIEKIYINVDGS